MIRTLSPVRPAATPLTRAATSIPSASPRLRFDPLAWLKLQFFASTWDCAVGGFGIAASCDPLHVRDFVSVPQEVTATSTWLDPVPFRTRGGRRHRWRRPCPQSVSRILILTHIGTDPTPTPDEEAIFAHTLRHRDWSALVVLTRGGGVHAHLALHTGPVRSLPLSIEVDWPAWAQFIEDQPHRLQQMIETWKDEYARHIRFAPEILDERLAPTSLLSSRRRELFGSGEDQASLRHAQNGHL